MIVCMSAHVDILLSIHTRGTTQDEHVLSAFALWTAIQDSAFSSSSSWLTHATPTVL